VTLATPVAGCRTQPSPGTQTSSVQGSPSSHVASDAHVDGAIVVVVTVVPVRNGSLRATVVRRPDSGSGVRRRSSYQPRGRPPGRVRVAVASVNPSVVQDSSASESAPYEPSVYSRTWSSALAAGMPVHVAVSCSPGARSVGVAVRSIAGTARG